MILGVSSTNGFSIYFGSGKLYERIGDYRIHMNGYSMMSFGVLRISQLGKWGCGVKVGDTARTYETTREIRV